MICGSRNVSVSEDHRAKWNPQKDLCEDEIVADAVTADLRTQKNSFSFQRCKAGASGTVDVEEATSAIVVAGNCIDKIGIQIDKFVKPANG